MYFKEEDDIDVMIGYVVIIIFSFILIGHEHKLQNGWNNQRSIYSLMWKGTDKYANQPVRTASFSLHLF